jgi:hypothetical protein
MGKDLATVLRILLQLLLLLLLQVLLLSVAADPVT